MYHQHNTALAFAEQDFWGNLCPTYKLQWLNFAVMDSMSLENILWQIVKTTKWRRRRQRRRRRRRRFQNHQKVIKSWRQDLTSKWSNGDKMTRFVIVLKIFYVQEPPFKIMMKSILDFSYFSYLACSFFVIVVKKIFFNL